MFDYGHGIVGYVLTLISLIHGSLLAVISFIVVAIIIYHQYNNRLKPEEKITLVLSANIYLLIFIYIIELISCNIQTLIGDVYGNNFNSSWCIFRSYFIVVMSCSMYHAFVIQVNK
jgi:tetrahydromethanopterin S-methyltransferase subunit C